MSHDQPFDVEAFRKYGKEMIDFICDYHTKLEEEKLPVKSAVQPGYLKPLLPDHAPEDGEPWEDIMKDVEKHIMPGVTHWQHPNFFAYFPASSSYPGIMGEMLSACFNVIGFNWVCSPACTELETVVMDWLAKLIALPEDFLSSGKGGGVIQGSASEAVIVSVLAAKAQAAVTHGIRDQDVLQSKLVAYISEHTHSSVQKACMIVGLPMTRLRKLPGDPTTFAFRGETLRKAVEDDKAAGLIPFFACGTIGTTSSTAVDNLTELGQICQEHGLWLHVDAAYAGSAMVCPEYRHHMAGVEYASSFCFNPHKWLLTNFDCSALWIKDRSRLMDALSITPEYLRNPASEAGLVLDYRDWQLPLGRRFRSLKLWFVLRSFGVNGLQRYIRESCRLGEVFESLVRSDSRFEICAPRTFSLVCFRMKGQSNQLNEKLLNNLVATNEMYLVHTVLNGTYVLRFSVGSHTKEEHVHKAWKLIVQLAEKLLESKEQETSVAASSH